MKASRVIVAAGVIVCLAVLGLLAFAAQKHDQTAAGRLSIKGFDEKLPGEATCASLTPSCGYCPGEVKKGACYVTYKQFDQYREIYPAVESN